MAAVTVAWLASNKGNDLRRERLHPMQCWTAALPSSALPICAKVCASGACYVDIALVVAAAYLPTNAFHDHSGRTSVSLGVAAAPVGAAPFTTRSRALPAERLI